MKSFSQHFLDKKYAQVEKLGDKLAEVDPLIDWEAFRPIIHEMYDNVGNVLKAYNEFKMDIQRSIETNNND